MAVDNLLRAAMARDVEPGVGAALNVGAPPMLNNVIATGIVFEESKLRLEIKIANITTELMANRTVLQVCPFAMWWLRWP